MVFIQPKVVSRAEMELNDMKDCDNLLYVSERNVRVKWTSMCQRGVLMNQDMVTDLGVMRKAW